MLSIWFFAFFLVLTAGFFGLLVYEGRVGKRVALAPLRENLDSRVLHAGILLRSIEYGPVLRELSRRVTTVILHELSAATLFVVRFLERTLTRLVKRLYRVRVEDASKGGSPFIEAIKEAKKEAEHTHKNGHAS